MIYQKDIKKLKSFVLDVNEDIGFVISHLYEINPDLERLDLPIKEAWEDLKPRFKEMIRNLDGKGIFGHKRMRDELANRGLLGIQLDLKLRLYRQCRKEAGGVLLEFIGISEEEKGKKRGIVGKVLGRLFRVTNRILESLGFIPGSHAIKEIKGILEEVLP